MPNFQFCRTHSMPRPSLCRAHRAEKQAPPMRRGLSLCRHKFGESIFKTIPTEDKVILAEIRRVKESLSLFSRICKWWAVRCAQVSIFIIAFYFWGFARCGLRSEGLTCVSAEYIIWDIGPSLSNNGWFGSFQIRNVSDLLLAVGIDDRKGDER